MNKTILEYLGLILSWPSISILIVVIFRKQLKHLLSSISRGGEAKFPGGYLKIHPLEIQNETTGSSTRKASVTLHKRTANLNEFHMNILKTFYEKGNYDALTVSKNLIEDFRELKSLEYLDWVSETTQNGAFILKDFILTESAKDIVKSTC